MVHSHEKPFDKLFLEPLVIKFVSTFQERKASEQVTSDLRFYGLLEFKFFKGRRIFFKWKITNEV